MQLTLTLARLKKKRPFRRNGLTSNDCLPYEKFFEVDLDADLSGFVLQVLLPNFDL